MRHLHAAPAPGSADREALAAFVARRDEAAFTAIVQRHGPMVLRACRRVLHHTQDAEDAFQATFLVLARKAGTVGRAESLASWLHGVAVRTALRAKRDAGRRRRREQQAPTGAGPDPAEALAWHDVQALLEVEIRRLPERYRAAFVLCHLEGRSRSEAAAELGLSENTLSSRLARARERLRDRLARRGVHLSAVLAAAALADATVSAVSPDFFTTTIRAGLQFAARQPVIGVTGHALQLTKEALTTMAVARMKWVAGVFAVGGLLAVGTWGAGQGPGGPAGSTGGPPAPEPAPAERPAAGVPDADYAQRQRSLKNLKAIALALQNYYDTNGRWPTDVTDKAGKPLLSWRVWILPFIEADQLYKQFKLDEPWDSPHNLKLLSKMPDVFRVAIDPKDATHTYYQRFAITGVTWGIVLDGGEGASAGPSPGPSPIAGGPSGPGPGSPPPMGGGPAPGPPSGPPGVGSAPAGSGAPPGPGLDPAAGPPRLGGGTDRRLPTGPPPGMGTAPPSEVPRFPRSFAEVTDGLSNTIGVVEAGPPVPWSKPADIHYDRKKPLPPMTGPYANVRNVSMMDGGVQAFRPKLDETVWRHLIEPNDGNVLPDLKTLRARFAADTEEEKKALDKLVEGNQALIAILEEQLHEHAALLGMASKLNKDVERAEEQAEELKRLVEAYRAKNRKLRDELGLRRDRPVEVPKKP
jgi:RNA polymerase sigma factor (sigma-70 family)